MLMTTGDGGKAAKTPPGTIEVTATGMSRFPPPTRSVT
jgi:hypothetical protein